MPVAHCDVDRRAVEFTLEETALCKRPPCQRWRFRGRRVAEADLSVAMLELFDDLVRQRTPACNIAEVLSHLAKHIRSAMCEQQDRATIAHRVPNSFTHSTVLMTFSTGVQGTIPCPRLKMCPGWPAAALRISRTRARSTSSGAKRVMGSRLPCTPHPSPTARHPASSGVRQSRPITSAPVSRIEGSSEAVSTPK